ncbi:MAG: arginyltransferase [Deltaproteobacteria bacterium]
MMQLSTVNNDYRLIRDHLEKFFIEIGSRCPYDKPYTAFYRQAALCNLPEYLFGLFMDAGYRRNGNSLYCMVCQECQHCVPIKIRPMEFVGPLCVSEERIALLQRFLVSRYPEKNSCARDYYAGFFLNSMTDTLEFRYSQGGRLIGVGIVDCGATWFNAVYFYFDPDFSHLSPGTFNILTLIDHAGRCGLGDLYLGYWIDGLAAMSYKERFKPHYLLFDGIWQRHGMNGREGNF